MASPADTETPSPKGKPEAINLPAEAGYDCVKQIGRGGYGSVYLLARKEADLRNYVAGKFVYRDAFGPSSDGASASAYQRAVEGLQNFRSLSPQSEYLLRIFDVRHRHEAGYFCYMMELADDIVSGTRIDPEGYRPKTLKNELERYGQRRRLPARRCVDIGVMLAWGLQILHDSGFSHRDVRPSNIIFVKNIPKLADIDLLAGNDATLVSYIPKDYAAPEGSHSSRADIFSLGKTLYEMCTGFPVQAYPTLPSDVRHWDDHYVLLKINKVIAKACARNLRERYDSAEHLLSDLDRIQST